MKKTNLSVFVCAMLMAVNVFADSFDPVSKQLTIPSVSIGNQVFFNVVVKLKEYEVLSVGSAGTAADTVNETCGAENFSEQILNLIQENMSLEQVNQTIGCAFEASATQRLPALGFVTYVWESAQAPYAYIRVWFDSTSTYTLPYKGSLLTQAGGF